MRLFKRGGRMPKLTVLTCLLVILVTTLTFGLVSVLSRRAIYSQEAASIAVYHARISEYINEALVNLGNSSLLQLSKDIPQGGIGRMEQDIDALNTLYRDIQILTRSQPDILSLYFYSEIDRKVFYYFPATNGIVDFEGFADLAPYEDHIATDAYTRLMPARRVPPSLPDRTTSPSENIPVVSLSIRLPFRERSRDVLVINLKRSFFDNLLNTSNLPADASFFLADDRGNVILTHTVGLSDSLTQEDYRAITGPSGAYSDSQLVKQELSGGEYHLFVSRQKEDRLFYLAVPSASIGASYTQLTVQVILLQIIILMAGIAFAVLLASTISRPLSGLLDRIRGEEPATKGAIRYPLLAEIGEQIDEIVERTRAQKESLDHYFSIYRQQGLLSLLRGDPDWEESLQNLGEDFRACRAFQVMITQGESAPLLARDLPLESMGISCIEAADLPRERRAYLVGYGEKPPTTEALRQVLSGLLPDGEEAGGARIAAGPAGRAMREISASYSGALSLLENEREADGPLLLHGDSPVLPQAGQPALERLHQEILLALEGGDLRRIDSRVDAMFQAMAQARFSLPRRRKQCLYLLYELSLSDRWERTLAQEEDLFREIQAAGDEQALQDKMRQALHRMVEGVREQDAGAEPPEAEAGAGNAGLIDQVRLYIQEHYHEDISLNLIADYLYFSPQYLGKLFRDVTGGSFTNYLVRTRMSAAAELLIRTRRSVAKIAEATGYSTVQSFGRVFKSYYGCTPGEYRRTHGSAKLTETE